MWRRVPLRNLARIRRGASPRPKGDPRYFGGSIPWLKIGDVAPGDRYVTETSEFVTDAGRDKSVLVQPGTLLLSNSASVGRPVITKIAACIHDGWLALDQFKAGCDQQFLYWFLVHSEQELKRIAPSGTQANLNTGIVGSFEVPLPPPSEQRRIVEILAQGDEILRLGAEVDSKTRRILPALFVRMFGAPNDWGHHPRARPLGELVQLASGATPSKKKGRFWDRGVPWVSPKDMKRDFLSDSEDHVSPEALEETNLKIVPIGSVLIVVRGMILIHSVPVALSLRELTINQDMKALMARHDSVSGPFLWAALKVAKTELLQRVGTAGHGTRKLDTSRLLELPVVVPTPDERRATEEAVQWLRVSSGDRERRARNLERLFSTLVHRAFSGNLTASWSEAHMKELQQEIEQQSRAL